jgi:hypothetical protein
MTNEDLGCKKQYIPPTSKLVTDGVKHAMAPFFTGAIVFLQPSLHVNIDNQVLI